MENSKKLLALLLGIVMVFGVTPAFAAGSGTNDATVTVTDAVSIVVSGNAAFGSLTADNQRSTNKSINITSTSNVPIDVAVKATAWATGGNLPLSALQFSGSYTPMTISDQSAITNMAPPNPGDYGTEEWVPLYIQIPFGSTAQEYSSTVTWTASEHV